MWLQTERERAAMWGGGLQGVVGEVSLPSLPSGLCLASPLPFTEITVFLHSLSALSVSSA